MPAAVLVPIGFVSDHMEVVHDLDTEALETAAEIGLPVARAATVGTDQRFVAMVRELVCERLERRLPSERRALGVCAGTRARSAAARTRANPGRP